MPSLKKNTSINDTAADFSEAASMDLTMLLEPFNLSILIKKDKHVLAYESYEALSGSMPWFSNGLDLNNIGQVQKKYKQTHILIANKEFTFMPDVAFNADMLKQYMDFNTDLEGLHHHAFDSIDELQLKLIYAIPFNLHANLNNLFPQVAVADAKSVLLKYCHANQNATEQLYVYVRNGSFDIYAFKNNNFVLGNTFSYQTAQDFIYFLMFVVKQLTFDNNSLRLGIGGHIEKDGAIYNIVYKYIRHVTFMGIPGDIVFSEAFEDMPPHFFINYLV